MGFDGRGVVEGDEVGPYRVLDQLGHGGMGTVVRARDPRLRRDVAVKIMRRGSDDPAHRARVLREAQALARLSHPNVVPVYDVGVHAGMLWIAMEYVRGPTLSQWLRRRRSTNEVLDAFVQAARGLAAAHAAGLVHRDFKPSNAMIGPAGRVMVLDFGLAWAPGPEGARGSGSVDVGEERTVSAASVGGRDPLSYTLTVAGAVMGTPPYMAPEQHTRSEVGGLADQYALCVALYEALYGRRPFKGSLEELVVAKAKGPPLPPKRSRVPRRVWKVVERGLEVDAGERWPSMDALIEALEHSGQRSPWVGAGSAAASIALVGAALLLLRNDPDDDGCAEVAARTQALRDGEARHAMLAAFENSTRQGATDAASGVLERVDLALDAWSQDVSRACAAEAEPSERMATLRCVERALDASEAALGVFVTDDDEAILHAGRIAEGLPRPTACRAAPLRETSAPGAEVQRELERTKALRRAGRTDDAIESAHEALRSAQASDDAVGSGHVLLQLGRLRADLGEWDAAKDDLSSALWAAIAIGDDELAAGAATGLIRLCAERFDAECAKPWIRQADSSLQRLGERAGDARRSFELALGDVALRRADLDEALQRYEAVLAEMIDEGGEEQLEVAGVLTNIGIVHAEANRPERALEAFSRAAKLEETIAGPLDPARASSYEHIALAHHRMGRVREAREAIDRAIELIDAAYGPEHPRALRLRGNLVTLLLDEGRWDDALSLAQRVVAAKRKVFGHDDVLVAMALTNEGLAYMSVERHEEALRSFRESLAIWERELGPDNSTLWYSLAGIAQATLATHQIEASIAASRRALKLAAQQGSPPNPAMVFTLADALWESGDHEAGVATMTDLAATLPEGVDMPEGRVDRAEVQQWLDEHAHTG